MVLVNPPHGAFGRSRVILGGIGRRQTPHQYKSRRRLETAPAMLVSTDRSVTGICFDAGFQSLGSFSALFQRVHGLTPHEYRRIRKFREVFPMPGAAR